MGLVFCHDWALKTAKDAATKTECACVCVLEMLLLELLAKTFHSLQAPVWNDGMHLKAISIFLGKSGFQCLIYMSGSVWGLTLNLPAQG